MCLYNIIIIITMIYVGSDYWPFLNPIGRRIIGFMAWHSALSLGQYIDAAISFGPMSFCIPKPAFILTAFRVVCCIRTSFMFSSTNTSSPYTLLTLPRVCVRMRIWSLTAEKQETWRLYSFHCFHSRFLNKEASVHTFHMYTLRNCSHDWQATSYKLQATSYRWVARLLATSNGWLTVVGSRDVPRASDHELQSDS
jgi:hypothetical protein